MRKTKLVVIDADNRDQGKVFLVTEMPAAAAENWASQALLALGRAGVEVPDDATAAGAAAILSAGIGAFRTLSWSDAEPLLETMMRCVQFVPDPKNKDPLSLDGSPIAFPLNDNDTEEVSTRFKLRSEVIELHLGFSPAAALSTLGAAVKKASSDTPTSR